MGNKILNSDQKAVQVLWSFKVRDEQNERLS